MSSPLEQLFYATTQSFYNTLQHHMPPSLFRDFNLWAFSPKNPRLKAWLQIMGVPQLAKLTETLLGDSVSEEQWGELVRYTTILNTYLIYEVISDNLAIGLAERRPEDDTYEARRDVLVAFNRAMVARLGGDKASADAILESIKPLAAKLSIFQQSLTNGDQQKIVESFLEAHAHLNYQRQDIEFGVWNALVANIEACAAVVNALSGFRLQEELRNSLMRRYAAVNDLLCNNITNREMLLNVGTDTILVVPVLTYYIAVLGEALTPNPQLAEVIENGMLHQSLADGALMVRLLNDLGTNLVAMDEFHRKLLDDLYNEVSMGIGQSTTSFPSLLLNHSEKVGFMTRIRKDLSFGEFNMSLHNLMAAPSNAVTLLAFGDNLLYFKQQYKQCQNRLSDNLKWMGSILGESVHCSLIHKFVYFHEHIYKYQFDNQAGDYATKPDAA